MKRGRNQRRRQGMNINRALDSNGPDVRIRGTANQIYDKYQSLARDAASAGDRVKAESYLQHAEHYFRLIKSIQTQNGAGNQQAGQSQNQSQSQDQANDPADGEQPDVVTSENAENARQATSNGEDNTDTPVESPKSDGDGEGAEKERPRRRRRPRSAERSSEAEASSEENAADSPGESSTSGEEEAAPAKRPRRRKSVAAEAV